MGGKFRSWYLANKVPLRAYLASFLMGLLTIVIASLIVAWFWSWYLVSKDNAVPLLTSLASLLTGLLTVGVGWLVASAALSQAKTARERHEEQTKADLQRRITESFTKAVEQLGNDNKPEVRLGGIYTLERIARESEIDYWPVMETLTAFVRERMRWNDDNTASSKAIAPRYPTDASLPPGPSSPTDIAAVLTVIKRRDARSRQREESEGWRLDLRLADLRGAQLNKAHLRGADLSGTHLEGADLSEAHLEGADLRYVNLHRADLAAAHLEGADLSHAHLGYATLSSAHLEGATLISTDLVWADLQSAHLEGTSFINANLTRTNLRGAHLEGADLQDARDLFQYQLDDAFGNAETKLPEGLTRPAHWLK